MNMAVDYQFINNFSVILFFQDFTTALSTPVFAYPSVLPVSY